MQLYKDEGEDFRSLTAEIKDDGSVVLSGYDLGPICKAWWDNDDYEFWVTVQPEHKDQLLLALIQQVFGGRSSGVDDFRDFCNAKGVPCSFHNR
jgi:hypothetical protein